MKHKNKIMKMGKKKTILIHSADKDMAKSLSILLQDQYGIVVTESVEELALQRKNKYVSLLVVDLERSIPSLLTEFEFRHQEQSNAPIIVLYAFRQGQPDWEKKIRLVADQVLYKPVQIDQILDAIAAENKLHKELVQK
jgi:DNA-binding NtrC family response regulator